MNTMTNMNLAALCASLAMLLFCAASQVVHIRYRVAQCGKKQKPIIAAYETALLIHLLAMCGLSLSLALGSSGTPSKLFGQLFGQQIPFAAILWVNVVVIVAAIVATVIALFGVSETADSDDSSETPIWMPPLEVVLSSLCLPPYLTAFGASWLFVLIADAAYFGFRTTYLLMLDARKRRRVVSQLAIPEAVKLLPEGLLYADADGRTILANDAMRHSLSLLGLPTDFAQVNDLWTLLSEKANNENSVDIENAFDQQSDAWLLLQATPEEVLLFSFEGSAFAQRRRYSADKAFNERADIMESAQKTLGSTPSTRVVCRNVTREVEIVRKIEEANAELAAHQEELLASMSTVRETAENEAMLRMRARVHDVIGQRLSMLHRALEDDASDEQIEQLRPLLNSILSDLATEASIDPLDELAATVEAFGLAGVDIRVKGKLPTDEARAKVIADCVRESATNAVKHAHATVVNVTINEDCATISNDGKLPSLPIREGTGLSAMRQAAASIKARLSVEALEEPFTIRINF